MNRNVIGKCGTGTIITNPIYTSNPVGVMPINSGSSSFPLLPMSIKVVAQTVGLDLVTVKPLPLPVGNLVGLDFVYDDSEFKRKELLKLRKKKINKLLRKQKIEKTLQELNNKL